MKVVCNESIHYTCFERRHKLAQYQPKNLHAALSLNTPFDPLKEKWKEAWLDDVKGGLMQLSFVLLSCYRSLHEQTDFDHCINH